jgi:hypothetical protein
MVFESDNMSFLEIGPVSKVCAGESSVAAEADSIFQGSVFAVFQRSDVRGAHYRGKGR